MPVASRIEEFLGNAPPGRLYVVVGYADVTGLAWLGRQAAERSVTLLIGDTRRRLFQGQPPDRRAALDLLARSDVEVLSGYRRGGPFVHQKVFVVASPGGDRAVAGLVGSANLTDAGLFRNEESVVTVPREELPAVWEQTRVNCARGRHAGERIAGYIREAGYERLQDSADGESRRNDTPRKSPPRRPAPGGGRGGGHPPAQRTGGGRGSRRNPLAGLGIALVGVLLLVGLCTATRNRAEPGTVPAAPTGSPSATSVEPQEAPPRTDAAPSASSPVSERSEQPPPGPDESDPQSIPPTTVSDGEPAIEDFEQGESTVVASEEAVTAVPSEGERRDAELDEAAVAALSAVLEAVRSIYEAEGGYGGASVAVLEGMGLTIPATSELAEATGKEDVALRYSTNVAVMTPWDVSVLAPDPAGSGEAAVWAVAVRSPVVCRAVVLDPDLGSWAGTSTSFCSGGEARSSYVQRRGVGGQRGNFHWAPATPERMTAHTAVPSEGERRDAELDEAAVAALSAVLEAVRSIYEAEGGYGGASVAVLEGMGLTIPATSELAEATGKEDVALRYSTNVAVMTPWDVSVLAPDPAGSGEAAVWAVAVRSPVVCRAVVLDPDLGSWAGTSTSFCSGGEARSSYVQRRGVGGQRGNFHWAPATPERMTGDDPLADESS